MTATETNADLQDALDFSNYVGWITGKEWIRHGALLSRILDRLYDAPGCQRHYAGFDNSFAYLSSDIIHEVVEQIDETEQLQRLVKAHGSWGEFALKKKEFIEGCDPELGDTHCEFTYGEDGFIERWNRLLRKAPKLHGKLALHELCGGFVGSGEQLYSALRPNFYDIVIRYDDTKLPYSTDQLKHLKEFVVKQLQSPCLRKLRLEINGDLDVEEELFNFCLSDKFESLDWKYLSPEFFLRVYQAYSGQQVNPGRSTRRITAFFDRSTLTEVVQTMNLKRHNGRSFFKSDRTPGSNLFVFLDYYSSREFMITIELEQASDAERKERASESPPKMPQIAEETEEDFADFDDFDDCAAGSYGCDGNCHLKPLTRQDWIEDDCEDCAGCRFCEEKVNYCRSCGRW